MTNDGILSQEEINALLNASTDEKTDSDNNNNEQNDSEDASELYLTSLEKDTIGEIGNISFGSSATALSTLLGMKVEITTPEVSIVRKTGILEEFPYEHVSLQVKYVEGFDGENIFLMKATDAAIISNIMLGGTGEDASEELSDIELSAVQEAMNQMMGSSATSMSTVFSKRVDISPPIVEYEEIDKLEEVHGITEDDVFVRVSFQLKVGDLIDSQIMQLIPLDFAKELSYSLLEPEPEKEEDLPVETDESVQTEPVINNATKQQEPIQHAEHKQQQIGAKVAKDAPVQTASFSEFNQVDLPQVQQRNLDMLLDIPLNVTVELGRTKQTVAEILELTSGSIIELDKLAGEPVDVLVNSKLVAKGEVVVMEENFGVRVTDIVSQKDRLQKLN